MSQLIEEETKLIQRTPPRCKDCRYPEEDSPKRILFAYKDEFGDEIVIIRCPDLKCGNGWLIQHAVNHIVFEKQDDVTDEVIALLKCKKEDIHIGLPEKVPDLSPLEVISALSGPFIFHIEK